MVRGIRCRGAAQKGHAREVKSPLRRVKIDVVIGCTAYLSSFNARRITCLRDSILPVVGGRQNARRQMQPVTAIQKTVRRNRQAVRYIVYAVDVATRASDRRAVPFIEFPT